MISLANIQNPQKSGQGHADMIRGISIDCRAVARGLRPGPAGRSRRVEHAHAYPAHRRRLPRGAPRPTQLTSLPTGHRTLQPDPDLARRLPIGSARDRLSARCNAVGVSQRPPLRPARLRGLPRGGRTRLPAPGGHPLGRDADSTGVCREPTAPPRIAARGVQVIPGQPRGPAHQLCRPPQGVLDAIENGREPREPARGRRRATGSSHCCSNRSAATAFEAETSQAPARVRTTPTCGWHSAALDRGLQQPCPPRTTAAVSILRRVRPRTARHEFRMQVFGPVALHLGGIPPSDAVTTAKRGYRCSRSTRHAAVSSSG